MKIRKTEHRQNGSSALARRSHFHPPSSILDPRPNPVADTPGSPGFARRSGFTLVELLVVITIIGVLMTLVIQVVGSFINQARESATASTIGKLEGLTKSRAQAFNRLLMRKGYLSGSIEVQNINKSQLLSNLAPTGTAQNAMATKMLEMRFFPQQITELGSWPPPSVAPSVMTQAFKVNNFINQSLINTYQSIFSQAQPPGQNISDLYQYNPVLDANHTLRSSEILYHILTQSNVLGNSPIGADSFSGAEVKDTPEIPDPVTGKLVGNGLPELIDAWGNPLRFYRWPTRLFRSGGAIKAAPYVASFTAGDLANAKVLFSSLPVFSGNLMVVGKPTGDLARDPDDPLQNFLNTNSVPFELLFHTPATYHVHLIVSAGPDGKLGLCEPDSVDPYTNQVVFGGNLALPSSDPDYQDQMSDNIMYLNVRAGGK